MRISDWSSDVCSSDLAFADHGIEAVIHAGALHKPDIARYPRQAFIDVNVTGTLNLIETAVAAGNDRFLFPSTTSLMVRSRSEERRVGKEWVSTCRSRWSPYH